MLSYSHFQQRLADLNVVPSEFSDLKNLKLSCQFLSEELEALPEGVRRIEKQAQIEKFRERISQLEKTICYEKYLTAFISNPDYQEYLLQGVLLQQEKICLQEEIQQINQLKEACARDEAKLKAIQEKNASIIDAITLLWNEEYQQLKNQIVTTKLKIENSEICYRARKDTLVKAKLSRKQLSALLDISDIQRFSS